MKKNPKDLNILFVDDEIDNLNAFIFNCEEFWNPHTILEPDEILLGKHSVHEHDAIIVDLVFDYSSQQSQNKKIDPSKGLELLDWLQSRHPQIPVMVLSAFLTKDLKELIGKKFPKIICKDKPLDFSKAEFRELMENFIQNYHEGKPSSN